ncbi:MAG TPA: hypothetical protein VF109_06730 [Mycobacteriales bacterium]
MSRAARRASTPGGFVPTGDRLPVPTRQRRPMLAVLAIVLILGGAAIAATLVLTSGQKQQYVLINRNIQIGETLHSGDFLSQPLAATNSTEFSPVLATDFKTQVEGTKALVPLYKGTLLTRGTFGPAVSPPVGLTDVALVVPEGAAPVDLAPGDVVKVLYTPRSTQGDSSSGGNGGGIAANVTPVPGKPLPRGLTLIKSARVVSVRDNAASQGSRIIGIQVTNEELADSPNAGLPAVAAASAGNAISVIRLDPTTSYPTGVPG